MVNKQLTRTEPVFWVLETVSKSESGSIKRHFQVKSGFYMHTLEVNNTTKYIVSPMQSGILVKQLDPEYVFLTEEEASVFIKELEAAQAESK